LGLKELNYDHVETLVGKAPISLDFRKHRYDIAFEVLGKRVLIEIQIAPLRREREEKNSQR
jgi:hypothetical protein